MTESTQAVSGEESESKPIDTFDGVMQFDKRSVDHKLIGQKLNQFRAKQDVNRPQFLVCHDMAGGYLQDKLADGYQVAKRDPPPFYMAHWANIDIFVYFSHHFCTIPPVTWVDAAHQNGVKILGTLITEGEDGSVLCEQILNPKNYVQFARRMAEIAAIYNFDGWLINIENVIAMGDLKTLELFLAELRTQCRSLLGQSIAKLIWYDAVIGGSGRLKWQDELNALNKPFFDCTDGIFLNYNWSEAALISSKAVATKDRQFDIFVGVDCFGRGCMGDGGFNSDLPLRFIRKHGLSVAVFAPGWVYEEKQLVQKEFVTNWHKFWSLLLSSWPCLPTKCLPFSTDFTNGCEPIKDRPDAKLFNLGNQAVQAHLCCSPVSNAFEILQSDWSNGLMIDLNNTLTPVKQMINLRLMCFQLAPTTKSTKSLIKISIDRVLINQNDPISNRWSISICYWLSDGLMETEHKGAAHELGMGTIQLFVLEASRMF